MNYPEGFKYCPDFEAWLIKKGHMKRANARKKSGRQQVFPDWDDIEVFKVVHSGKNMKQIAAHFGVSVQMTYRRLYMLRKKYGVVKRTQLPRVIEDDVLMLS